MSNRAPRRIRRPDPRLTRAGAVVLGLALLLVGPASAAPTAAGVVGDLGRAPGERAAFAGWSRSSAAPAGGSVGAARARRALQAGGPASGLLVTSTDPRAAADLDALVAAGRGAYGSTSRRLLPTVARVEVPAGHERAVARRLAAVRGVRAVEPNRVRTLSRVPDDAAYAAQWAHRLVGAERAWDTTTGSKAVRVAVIDSGMVGSHPDLRPNLVEQVDASEGTVRRRPLGSDNDTCQEGHATFVGGVIGAAGNNGRDVAGVSWEVSLIDMAAMSQTNGCILPDDAILAAIGYAVQHPDGPVDVINLSLGSLEDACPQAYQEAFAAARAAEIVVVAASGNEERSPALAGSPSVPASCDGVISVGAVGPDGSHAGYSTSNRWVDLAGPGGDSAQSGSEGEIIGLAPGGGTRSDEGTSFAAPYVTGVAALVRAAAPQATALEVEGLLESTARDGGAQGRDPRYGWGVVDAGAAVARAAAGAPYPLPQPDPDFAVEPGETTPTPSAIERVSAGDVTEPITQAVAVSRRVFAPATAEHAVLARADDFADALAGSALGFGLGPLLFTASEGPLAEATRRELRRVLPEGATVYLLGGGAALPVGLEAELAELGYQPERLSGRTREETAVVIGDRVRELLPSLGFENLPIVLLVTRGNWPDAVAAGSIASWFGIPILLTPPTTLHPATEDALRRFDPDLVYVVGGNAAVSAATEQAAQSASGADSIVRLSGPERTSTAVAVAREMELIVELTTDQRPMFAIGVNLRRADGYAHVLSGSVITGANTGVFVPVEAEDGTILTEPVREYVTGLGIDGMVLGGADIVSAGIEEELEALLRAE